MSTELVIFNEVAARTAIFVKTLHDIQVTDDRSLDTASLQLREAKVLSDKFDDLRRSYVDPLNQRVKLANAFVKEQVAPLEIGINHVKGQLRNWEMKLKLEREAALKRAEEERRRLEEEARVAAAKPVQAMPTCQDDDEWGDGIDIFAAALEMAPDAELAQVTRDIEHQATMAQIAHTHKQTVKAAESTKVKGARSVWKYKVLDIKLVPEEMIERHVDDFKMRKLLRESTDPSTLSIPGIEVYEDVIIAAGRR